MNKVIRSTQKNSVVLSDPFVQMIQQQKPPARVDGDEQHRFLEDLKKRAQEQGYKKGYEAGLEAAKTAMLEQFRQAETLVQQLKASLQQSLSGLETITLSAALELLKHCILDTQRNRDAIRERVKSVVLPLKEKTQLNVRVSPEDYQSLHPDTELMNEWQVQHGLRWIPDETISRGGCVVETDAGIYDARFETQLESLRRILVHE